MTSQSEIYTALEDAMLGRKPLSIDLYVEALAGHEKTAKASLNADADDALLCVLADERDVAMLLVDWDGTIYRNEHALKRVRQMWQGNFEVNLKTILPIFVEHISQNNLGVAGIKWVPEGGA